jgi:hypothetical protein
MADSNAELPDTLEDGGGDFGTDAEVVTLEESQGTNEYEPDNQGELVVEEPVPFEGTSHGDAALAEINGTDLTTSPGAGPNDDNTGFLDTLFNAGTSSTLGIGGTGASSGKITPQSNVLDRFATYNYTASVYLMSPTQHDTYVKTGKRNVTGYNLLFQSGGAPNNVGGPQGGQGSNASGRNPFFPNDFYIDSITLNNDLFGKSTNATHSVANMKFTVIEPSNITLIDCLYSAVQDMAPKGADGAVNYASAVYLMVIRFYGQDINGVVQRVGAPTNDWFGSSDADSVVEKFIPFRIRHVNFTVGSKLVTYEFDCAPNGQIIANGTRRGSIPADVELSGSTVGDLLSGDAVYGGAQASATTPGETTTASAFTVRGDEDTADYTLPAPAKANAAPNNKKTIKQGLMVAMNDFQKQLVKDEVYEKADVYEIEFAKGAESIRDAKIAKPDAKVNKSATAMAKPPSQDPSQSSPTKSNVDVTTRNWGITAGMQIVQALDLIIRNSSYITDQAVISIDEETGKPKPNPKATTQGMKWYNILMQATQLEYDNIRNDFAHRIKFVIVPYTLADFSSPYFPMGKFQGVHKKYSWWFTGQNTQVLDYTATFNKLYSLTVSGNAPKNSSLAQQRKKQTSSMRDVPFVNYQARSTESSQGAEGKANELAASAAEYLYNPSDNANCKVRIIGDPAWIQQGSMSGAVSKSVTSTAFLADGTINFDVNDILFEIAWQRPEDYSLNSGLADPYGRTQKTFGDRTPIQSVIYRAKSVTTEFRQGKFEQTIDGTLYNYPIPAGTNKATTAGNPSSGGSGGTTSGVSDAAAAADATRDAEENMSGAMSESAKMSTYGEPGMSNEPDATLVNPSEDTGEFNDSEPTSSDNAALAEPALDVTSNGEEIGVSTDEDTQLNEDTQYISRDW